MAYALHLSFSDFPKFTEDFFSTHGGGKKKKQNVIKIKMLHCYVNKLFLKHSTQKKKRKKTQVTSREV